MKRITATLAVATISILGFMGSPIAGAQSDDDVYVTPSSTIVSPPTTVPDEVLDNEEVSPPTGSQESEVLAAEASSAADTEVKSSGLAFTGQNASILVGIGLAAILAGGLALTLRRRTATN